MITTSVIDKACLGSYSFASDGLGVVVQCLMKRDVVGDTRLGSFSVFGVGEDIWACRQVSSCISTYHDLPFLPMALLHFDALLEIEILMYGFHLHIEGSVIP